MKTETGRKHISFTSRNESGTMRYDSKNCLTSYKGTAITYDAEGNAYRDIDMTNHRNPKNHPEYPHEHIWEWINEVRKKIIS